MEEYLRAHRPQYPKAPVQPLPPPVAAPPIDPMASVEVAPSTSKEGGGFWKFVTKYWKWILAATVLGALALMWNKLRDLLDKIMNRKRVKFQEPPAQVQAPGPGQWQGRPLPHAQSMPSSSPMSQTMGGQGYQSPQVQGPPEEMEGPPPMEMPPLEGPPDNGPGPQQLSGLAAKRRKAQSQIQNQ